MDEYTKLSEAEKLQAENEYLQMKIMLEHGAQFHFPENENDPLDPVLQNAFLNNIIEFEQQWENNKQIKIFEKIGRPQHFRPVNEIGDDAIENEWRRLSEYMRVHGIALDACSPRITARELYRFSIEELFEKETDDISIPDMITNFIYDEFYPDHEYDTTCYATDDFIRGILDRKPVRFLPWLGVSGLQFNAHSNLTDKEFIRLINQLKKTFDQIEVTSISDVRCVLTEASSEVSGSYRALITHDGKQQDVAGNWHVAFVMADGYWDAVNVQIENL